MLDRLLSWLWVNHPRMKAPDAMLTFSAIALLTCVLKVIFNDVTIKLASGHTFNLGHIDATVIAAMLGPTLMAYWGRKKDEPPNPPKEK